MPVTTKDELLRLMATHYDALSILLMNLNDAQLNQPNVIGTWSVKDMVAHLIAHEQRALRELEAAKRGEAIQQSTLSADDFNARFVTEGAKRSPKVMLLAWGASFRQLLNAVGTLDNAAFETGSSVQVALGDTIEGAVANNSYEHYQEHLPEIKAWMEKNGISTSVPIQQENPYLKK
jgi:hypothetical protein